MSPTPVAFATLFVAVSGQCPALGPNDCKVTATTGCLNGVSFGFSRSFACGPQQTKDRQAIFDWDKVSCCALGNPFDTSTGFCCNNGIHSYSAGECRPWTQNFPSWCYCDGADTSSAAVELKETEAEPSVNSIDTLKVEYDCPCGGANATMGCLNGHWYDYATQYPCGNHLANWADTGCCPTANGLETYNMNTQSCCRSGDTNVIHNYGHACECEKYGCGGMAV